MRLLCLYVVLMRLLCRNVVAPGAPAEVYVTSNVTDVIVVQWTSPRYVIHRVDRYYVQYQATDDPDSHELVIDEVNNSFDVYQVG